MNSTVKLLGGTRNFIGGQNLLSPVAHSTNLKDISFGKPSQSFMSKRSSLADTETKNMFKSLVSQVSSEKQKSSSVVRK
jgi:3-deoxy-D-manno-octulosonic-acid transferase